MSSMDVSLEEMELMWERDKKSPPTLRTARGFSTLRELPQVLGPFLSEHLFDHNRKLSIGFFTAEDLTERMMQGWFPLKTNLFDRSKYNKTVPLQFGLSEREGLLWYRELAICFKDRDRVQRDKQRLQEFSQKRYQKLDKAQQVQSSADSETVTEAKAEVTEKKVPLSEGK